MMSAGIVYLVGAGPGDPKLITVRGLECLRQAEVVIYDRLVNAALLDEAPVWAERIFVGKTPGIHSFRQEEINAMMIERAWGGQVVVRLKGGDPFVFGRGGEEAAACAAAGVRCEVVPGITSAISVPARAGIPVTHRGLSASFVVITAHRAGDRDDDLNWAAIAAIDTLVVLMGVGRLSHIVARLLEHGRSPKTPAAIIERGTQPDECIVTGALGDIVERATLAGIRPPATIVVGEVVRLRETLHHGAGAEQLVASHIGLLPTSHLLQK
jgi:uroporphyrinogen III methyltransferase/synthase